jgi:hypothetical protein
MMRSLTLALLGLALAGTPALAAKRGESSGSRPEARVAPGKPDTAGRGRVAAAPRQAMVRKAAPIRGRQDVTREDRAASASGAACLRVRGTTRCRAQSVLGGSISGWARDLPPAAGVQAEECPSGTMATLARGHEDIIRCMPI